MTTGLPLAGRVVLVTRAREQAAALSGTLARRGARVIESPLIAFVEPADWAPLDAALRALPGYDLVLFTSANTVERFHARRSQLSLPWPAGPPPRVIAIGEATAARLAESGMPADSVAAAPRAEGVLDLLGDETLRGARVLLPRAEEGREILPEGLRQRGARVDVAIVYRTVGVPLSDEARGLLAAGCIDVVTLTSPATVRWLLAELSQRGAAGMGGARVAVLGPVTADAAREAGLAPDIVADGGSMEALADAIERDYARRS